MSIISVRNNENNRWKRNAKKKKKKTKTEKNKGYRSYNERVRAKWFCCVFKLGFLQLISKTSVIFNSNLYLALSIKAKRIIWVKACCGGVQMFENMRLVVLFDMLLNPSFRMAASFVNIIGIFYCLNYTSLLLHLIITHLVIDFITTM